jgi:hypothetical protein
MYYMGMLEDDENGEEEEQRIQRRRSEMQRARIISGILTIMLVAYSACNAVSPSYDDNLTNGRAESHFDELI